MIARRFALSTKLKAQILAGIATAAAGIGIDLADYIDLSELDAIELVAVFLVLSGLQWITNWITNEKAPAMSAIEALARMNLFTQHQVDRMASEGLIRDPFVTDRRKL